MHHLVAKVTVKAVKDYDPPHVLKKSTSRRRSSMENVKRYESTNKHRRNLDIRKKQLQNVNPDGM